VEVDREVTTRLEREHYDPEARSGHQRSGRCQDMRPIGVAVGCGLGAASGLA
jgi:hypothetical protein